jgi:hypothetical protein
VGRRSDLGAGVIEAPLPTTAPPSEPRQRRPHPLRDTTEIGAASAEFVVPAQSAVGSGTGQKALVT